MLDQFQDEIKKDIYLKNHLLICPSRIRAAITDQGHSPQTIVDFGCGHGIKAIAIAHAYPDAEVIGIDITDAFKRAEKTADRVGGMPKNLTFKRIEPGKSISSVASPDLVYSWSVMEHIPRSLLPDVIDDIHKSLKRGGLCLTQIAPLFFSPFGSHLREFCGEPWAHLIMSHDQLRQTINASGKDGATGSGAWMFERFEELNKITADELAGYFDGAGFTVALDERKRTDMALHPALHSAFQEDALRTFELVFVHRK